MTDYTDTDLAALIRATTVGYRGLADDTVRLTVDIEPGDADRALELFRRRGTTLILAAIRDDAAQAEQQGRDVTQNGDDMAVQKAERKGAETSQKGLFGKHASTLHTSGFWSAPPLIQALVKEHERDEWFFDHVGPADEDAIREDARDILKRRFGYDSWADVPPPVLRQWCEGHDLQHILPTAYRGRYDNPGDWPPVREIA